MSSAITTTNWDTLVGTVTSQTGGRDRALLNATAPEHPQGAQE